MNQGNTLAGIPVDLRTTLLEEYRSIVLNYSEQKWLPTELRGGRFCEIVFTILEGYASGQYPTKPKKSRNFVDSCQSLEKNSTVPRSFQILIPRLLPALYEVRNNRGVGHAGGEVDSNHMDATFVITSCNWVMAELVRVFHQLSVREAQNIVDDLVDRRVPLIWEGDGVRRVLDPTMTLQEKILLLLGTQLESASRSDLLNWIEYEDVAHFKRLLKKMHGQRLLELAEDGTRIQILPPGRAKVSEIIRKKA